LGADPSDPTGTATVETSLLYQLWHQMGWTLSNLGGITHQTISGFTATGSSGGSVQYSVNDDLWGFRVIDGQGNVHVTKRGDPDFDAMSPNLGLLGVVSTVTLQCVDAYNICGQEAVTSVKNCAIDLCGPGTPEQPSLETFLRDAEYARLEWWPQRGAELVTVWQAQRIAPQPGFRPTAYKEFTTHPELAEVAISILLTLFGNLHDLSAARPQLKETFERVESFLELAPSLEKLGKTGVILAKFLTCVAELGVTAAFKVLRPFASLLERDIPEIFPKLLGLFVQLDDEKSGADKGEPQAFRDYAWQGLPMDNAADDELLRTAFTEIWVPITRTMDAMRLLKAYFDEPTDDREAYARTGLNAWELYAAKPTSLWLSASHTDGEDEWSEGVFRIDPYWFVGNGGDPVSTFYAPLWNRFRDSDIPFRLHWGKYQPPSDSAHPEWVSYFKAKYCRWDDFLALRASRDPDDLFLTDYWRDRFGLWRP
jgi:D-arabinono-1,4-lactone oxidase